MALDLCGHHHSKLTGGDIVRLKRGRGGGVLFNLKLNHLVSRHLIAYYFLSLIKIYISLKRKYIEI